MGTVAQGMAFGTGSAIAHRSVPARNSCASNALTAAVVSRAVGAVANAMTGGGSDDRAAAAPAQPQEQQPVMCGFERKSFNDCMQKNNNDATLCNDLFLALSQCQSMNKQYA
jgi:hypothetical protein